MLTKNFPAPCRVNYIPSPYEPDEDGVMDVGYKIGRLSDGRAYRLECWRMDDMLMLTVLFDDAGLEAYCRDDMYLLLECEDILRFAAERRPLQAARTRDDADRGMWAVNLMLADKRGRYGELLIELNRYK